MRNLTIVLGALWATFFVVDRVSAQISVGVSPGTTLVGGGAQITYGPNGANIIVNAIGSPAGVIFVDATQANVRVNTLQVVPQQSAFPPNQHNLAVVFRENTGTFGFIGTVLRVGSQGAVTLSSAVINGSPGTIGDPSNPGSFAITVDTIGTISAPGDVAVAVTATGSLNAGNISLIRSRSGNITGDISAAGLVIGIEAAGTIGTSTRTSMIAVGQSLQRIQGTAIFADIHGFAGANTPVGDVFRLYATSGSFTGSILATALSGGTSGVPNVEVAGNLDANITVAGNVTKPIWVGGSLPSGRTLQIGGGGLQSQVTINRLNSGGTWAGTVRVDGITLTPNAYAQLPGTLGGGAVGVAPFSVHTAASTPPRDQLGVGQGILETTLRSAAIPIKIEHYGPITVNNSLRVECRPFGASGANECNWVDATDAFETIEPGTNGLNARTVGIRVVPGMIPRGGEYRVILATTQDVVCSEVSATPSVSWPVNCTGTRARPAYVFRVIGDCDENGVDDLAQFPAPNCSSNCHVADFNNVGGVTVQDLFDFLDAWFAGLPAADVNASGSVSVQDIFDFLAAWFTCGV